MKDFKKTVRIGLNAKKQNIYCKIEFKEGKLSISGVEGPMSNGDCRGGCGQIDMYLRDQQQTITPAPGWTPEMIAQFFDVWGKWHLNDMRANCEHQVGPEWTPKDVELVTYGLNSEGFKLREEALKECKRAGIAGDIPKLNDTGKALLTDVWFKALYTPPDADSPLSGLFDVKKRELESTGWLNQSEHPEGYLSKACPVCGHKYGSEWLREEIPQKVVSFLKSLPDTDKQPAWV